MLGITCNLTGPFRLNYSEIPSKWVNQIAKDYTIKGWVMDDERLKRGAYLTEKYFDEQLERIREIRASERMFYQKITDLYATAIDYDKEVSVLLFTNRGNIG